MEKSAENISKKAVAFLSVVCVVLAVATAFFAYREGRLKERERLMNEKAVSSLCESLDSISVSLRKSVYTGDNSALEKIGNELCRQASCAKESLGQLDFDDDVTDELYRFLSQVGNFTLAVSKGEKSISKENAEKLTLLCRYAEKLSEGMNEICLDYYNGRVSFDDAQDDFLPDEDELPEDFYSRVYDTAQTMTDYPTLVYDGPFADNISKKKSVFLEGKKEITAKEAQQKAAELLGIEPGTLRREQDISSQPELYCFSVGGRDVSVTKKGGYICTYLSDTFATEETISEKEAMKRAEDYLLKFGYENMKSSYYSVYDGICTVNFAYAQGGVICYGDLIKVSVALDTGKLMGLDAKNYLLNHNKRNIAAPKLTATKAEKLISPSLEVVDTQLAVIPLDTGKEAYCYELLCRDKEKNEVLVYINADTGRQEDLLLLLYSDGGILTK